mgnify:CR=1 FL=1
MKKFLFCFSLVLICAFSVLFAFPTAPRPASAIDVGETVLADDEFYFMLSYAVESGTEASGGTIIRWNENISVQKIGVEFTLDFTPSGYYYRASGTSGLTINYFDKWCLVDDEGNEEYYTNGSKLTFSESDVTTTNAGEKFVLMGATYVSKNVYTVTFLSTPRFQTFEVVEGGKVQEIQPTLAGYSFEGWYVDEALTSKFDFENYTITKDIRLYPKFTKQQAAETKTEAEQQIDGLFSAMGIPGLEIGVQIFILIAVFVGLIMIFK